MGTRRIQRWRAQPISCSSVTIDPVLPGTEPIRQDAVKTSLVFGGMTRRSQARDSRLIVIGDDRADAVAARRAHRVPQLRCAVILKLEGRAPCGRRVASEPYKDSSRRLTANRDESLFLCFAMIESCRTTMSSTKGRPIMKKAITLLVAAKHVAYRPVRGKHYGRAAGQIHWRQDRDNRKSPGSRRSAGTWKPWTNSTTRAHTWKLPSAATPSKVDWIGTDTRASTGGHHIRRGRSRD